MSYFYCNELRTQLTDNDFLIVMLFGRDNSAVFVLFLLNRGVFFMVLVVLSVAF